MMSTITSTRVRTRIEVQYAVLFDQLSVPYRDTQKNTGCACPVPDFWLPTWDCFVEIRPTAPTATEIAYWDRFVSLIEAPVLVLWGPPRPGEHGILRIGAYPGAPLQYNEFAACRKCDGICLYLGNGNGGWDGWGEIGPHTCGDHDRTPSIGSDAPRVEAAYEAAQVAIFDQRCRSLSRRHAVTTTPRHRRVRGH